MLTIKNLDVFSKSKKHILKDVSFSIEKNKTLCVLGESGSGKSVLAYTIMDILHRNLYVKNGTITFLGKSLNELDANDRRSMLGEQISLVMQNPMISLDPTVMCGKQIEETIKFHNKKIDKKTLKTRAIELLKSVNLDEDVYKKYPFEISGGMAQKVVIAIAIANTPPLIIADEPITALDKKNSLEILNLLKDVKNKNKSSLLYISHDIDSVAYMADFILVLYKGEVMEFLSIDDFNKNPLHPYTKDLLGSVISSSYKDGPLIVPVKSGEKLKNGCSYYRYCNKRSDECKKPIPTSFENNRIVKCINI